MPSNNGLIRRFQAASLIAVLVPALSRADLVWKHQTIELAAKPGAQTAETQFHFSNNGPTPINIRELRPSCSCTKAESAKTSYAPGESGDINTTVDLRGLVGLQEKSVEVFTDEQPAKPIVLIFRVTVPEVLHCSSKMLLWKNGEAPTEKSITCEATAAGRILSIEVKSIIPQQVSATITPIEPGKTYQLTVHPIAGQQLSTAAVACLAKIEGLSDFSFTIFALAR